MSQIKQIVRPRVAQMHILPQGEAIHPNRPSVVSVYALVAGMVASGQLTVLADNLPSHANDADFERLYVSKAKDKLEAGEESDKRDQAIADEYVQVVAKREDEIRAENKTAEGKKADEAAEQARKDAEAEEAARLKRQGDAANAAQAAANKDANNAVQPAGNSSAEVQTDGKTEGAAAPAKTAAKAK